MPIDPSIILGVRPTQIQAQDPIAEYSKAATLKALLGQNQLQDRQMEDDSAVRSAYQQAGSDSKALRSLLGEKGQYKAVQTLDKFQLEQDEKRAAIKKQTADADKSAFDVAMGKLQHGAALLDTAKDQPSWETALRAGVMTGTFSPEFVAGLPKDFNPQIVASLKSAGLTRAQQLEAQNRDATLAETNRSHLANEGNAAATLTETRRSNKFKEENPGLQHIETPDGVGAFNPRSGTVTPVLGPDGKPVQGGKALTESQGKATGMALRAQTADDTLLSLEQQGINRPGNIKGIAEGLGRSVPLVGEELGKGMGAATNFTQSPEQQRVEQAQRDFVNAVLRVESGASISQSEFDNARRQYFPQIGDDPATIKQKRDNRKTAIESLKVQAGPGSKTVVSKPQADKPAADPAKMSDDDLKKALGIPL